MRLLLCAAAAGAAGLAWSAAPLRATSSAVGPADLPSLVAGAQRIAEVRVLDAQPALLPDGRIETRFALATLAPLKGAQSALQELRMPGGEVAGRGLLLPGLPRLAVGQRLILFLSEPTAERGWSLPVGLGAGAFEVRSDAAGAAQVVGLDPQAESHTLDHDAFLAAILAEVERQAGPR